MARNSTMAVTIRMAPLAPLPPNRTVAARTSGTGKYSRARNTSACAFVGGIPKATEQLMTRPKVSRKASSNRARLGGRHGRGHPVKTQVTKTGIHVKLPNPVLRKQRHQKCQ